MPKSPSSTSDAVIIHGSSRGIGLATAQALSNNGIGVIGTATSKENLSKLPDQLGNPELFVDGFVLDISKLESLNNFFSTIDERGA